jgi:CBS domain-containing protein
VKARQVITDTVHAVTPETPIGMAAEFLSSHGFTARRVTDEDGNLVGHRHGS